MGDLQDDLNPDGSRKAPPAAQEIRLAPESIAIGAAHASPLSQRLEKFLQSIGKQTNGDGRINAQEADLLKPLIKQRIAKHHLPNDLVNFTKTEITFAGGAVDRLGIPPLLSAPAIQRFPVAPAAPGANCTPGNACARTGDSVIIKRY